LWDAVEERHAQEVCRCFLPRPFPFPSPSLPSFDSSIQTETNLATQVKEAAEKAMEEYRRDHPDIDESAIKVDFPEAPAPAQNPHWQGQAVVAPAVIPNMFNPFHIYNPNPNLIVGQALVYPQVQPVAYPQVQPVVYPQVQPVVFPPPRPHRVPVRRRQAAVAHQRQPHQPRLAPNARARAAADEELQRQAQQKRQAVANFKAERARLEQVRLMEEENRARQGLDRVRDQRAAARREQQERVWLALELERQRQGERQRQP
jgi:hypothetical protein